MDRFLLAWNPMNKKENGYLIDTVKNHWYEMADKKLASGKRIVEIKLLDKAPNEETGRDALRATRWLQSYYEQQILRPNDELEIIFNPPAK